MVYVRELGELIYEHGIKSTKINENDEEIVKEIITEKIIITKPLDNVDDDQVETASVLKISDVMQIGRTENYVAITVS